MPKRIAAMSFSVHGMKKKSRGSWYRIENKADLSQVHIYADIGSGGITAKGFLADLADVQGPLEIHLNSGGGEVFDGLAIYSALRQRGNVSVVIDSLAASIASVIAMSADEGMLTIAKNATMMIHDGFGMTIGNAADMRQMADLLDKTSDNISSIYADRTGRPAEEWRGMMKTEKWFSAQEAVDSGLADQVLPDIKNHISNADNNGYVKRDGKWVFDPDNDGDDDSTPSGDTDHDYWSADGKQLKPIPPDPDGKQGKPLTGSSATEILNWDGSAAMSAAANSEDPAAAYRAICAGKRAGDPAKQSTWALPHHAHPGDAPDEAGVRNALSRLPQTQGLVNEAAAKAHLQAHMSQISPHDDWNPSVIFGSVRGEE